MLSFSPVGASAKVRLSRCSKTVEALATTGMATRPSPVSKPSCEIFTTTRQETVQQAESRSPFSPRVWQWPELRFQLYIILLAKSCSRHEKGFAFPMLQQQFTVLHRCCASLPLASLSDQMAGWSTNALLLPHPNSS